MDDKLLKIAEDAANENQKAREIVKKLKERNKPPNDSAEDFLVRKEKGSLPDMKVCGIDGGILHERMHGIDIIAFRAVAVCFEYMDGKVVSCSHIPSRSPDYAILTRTSLDEHEAMIWRGVVRWSAELSMALTAMDCFSPDLMLLDGSINPHPSQRPAKTSSLEKEYQDMISTRGNLIDICESCILAGIVKDTRARTLSERIEPEIPDSMLSWHLLEEGERTCCISMEEGSCFYIRPSSDDIPLRIEFPGNEAGQLPSIINGLSSISRYFAYPSVLIEADMCAAMDPNEMEGIKNRLQRFSNGSIRPMRRSARPFR